MTQPSRRLRCRRPVKPCAGYVRAARKPHSPRCPRIDPGHTAGISSRSPLRSRRRRRAPTTPAYLSAGGRAVHVKEQAIRSSLLEFARVAPQYWAKPFKATPAQAARSAYRSCRRCRRHWTQSSPDFSRAATTARPAYQ
jgi:hypothetical protein